MASTALSGGLEQGGYRSWENLKKAQGLDRASTVHNLKSYGEEQRRLYQELPFRALPGMRRRSFRSEREFPQLRPRSSWANLSRLVKKHGEIKPLLDDEDDEPEPGYTYPLLVSCTVAVINAFQYGYNTAITGALNPNVVFPGHSDMLWALCVSSFAVGGPFGSILGGQLSGAIGRKKTMYANSCLFLLSGLVMAFAFDMYMLIIGRFLVGIASGTATVIVPLYLGELAPPSLRGALGTTYQVAMVLGILATIILAFGFAGESEGITRPGWRLMFGFAGILGALQLVLSPLLVESPRWLLNNGNPIEAEKTLRKLRQTDDVSDEIDNISAANSSETGDIQGVGDVLRDKNIRLPLLVAVVLQLGQQLSGINAVMFYASSFFESAGLENPLVGITLVYIVNVLATIVALMLMDSAGRRALLLWSIVGMLVSSAIMTVGLLDLVAVFEHSQSEMFPPKSRTSATSIATMVNWIGLFVIGIVFPAMQAALGDFIFVPFAFLLTLTLGFSLKFVPETKGKTLDEIQAEINSHH
ncbi:unnamed protein product [Peronospora effusa]|nr:unnamed protein product [Peronospora effusa]